MSVPRIRSAALNEKIQGERGKSPQRRGIPRMNDEREIGEKNRIKKKRKIHRGKVQGNPQQKIPKREAQKNNTEEREDSTEVIPSNPRPKRESHV